MVAWIRSEFVLWDWPLSPYPESDGPTLQVWDDFNRAIMDTDDDLTAAQVQELLAVRPFAVIGAKGLFDELNVVAAVIALDPDSPSGLKTENDTYSDAWAYEAIDPFFWRNRLMRFGGTDNFLWCSSLFGDSGRMDEDTWTPYEYRDSYYRYHGTSPQERFDWLESDQGASVYVVTPANVVSSGWRIGEAGLPT